MTALRNEPQPQAEDVVKALQGWPRCPLCGEWCEADSHEHLGYVTWMCLQRPHVAYRNSHLSYVPWVHHSPHSPANELKMGNVVWVRDESKWRAQLLDTKDWLVVVGAQPRLGAGSHL